MGTTTSVAISGRQLRLKQVAEDLLSAADVQIDGARPWDMQIHHPGFYERVLSGGVLALGEAYMDGWWDCQALDELFFHILSADLRDKVKAGFRTVLDIMFSRARNLQSPSRATEVGKRHYDLGNDLFRQMLDRRMMYSCAYWHNARTLDEAQEAKLDLICRKLYLEPGMRVLDIGCGWGGFARYAAEQYGVSVVGITISEQQVLLAREYCAGLPIEIRLQDYRALNETFDRIVSIGMFEHVGYKNYRMFMDVTRRALAPEGIFLLHTIGANRSGTMTDPWTSRYIFPNSMTPSARQLADALEGTFIVEDWHNIGPHYDPTLLAWYRNFEAGWNDLKGRYDERFYRMWRYFLLMSAGSFRARYSQVYQLVLSAKGLRGGYQSVR